MFYLFMFIYNDIFIIYTNIYFYYLYLNIQFYSENRMGATGKHSSMDASDCSMLYK